MCFNRKTLKLCVEAQNYIELTNPKIWNLEQSHMTRGRHTHFTHLEGIHLAVPQALHLKHRPIRALAQELDDLQSHEC